MEHDRLPENKLDENELYEPPALIDLGGFQEQTMGGAATGRDSSWATYS